MLYVISFLMGFVFSRILFGGSSTGPFEKSLMQNLLLGKRVVVCVDEDAFIFEMEGNKVKITVGVADFTAEPHLKVVETPAEPEKES